VSFFFSSRRRHTRWPRDWSSDVCSSDLMDATPSGPRRSLFAENRIEEPAAAHVLARLATVAQDRLIRTAGVFQRVAEDRHALERSEERRVGKECRARGS